MTTIAWLRAFRSRVSAVLTGRRHRAAIEQELADHVELLAEEYVRRGMTADVARTAARQRFGGVTALRDELYERSGLPFLDTLFQDLRSGARALRNNPEYSMPAILVLALGIGLSTAIFTLVDALLLHELPYRDADRIVLLNRVPTLDFEQSRSAFATWRRNHPIFEDVALISSTEVNLSGSGEPAHVHVAQVTSDFVSVLGTAPSLGRGFAPDEDIPGRNSVALLSNRIWTTQFGADPRAIGRQIRLNQRPFTIIGVLPGTFDYPASTEIWVPTAHTLELSQSGAIFVMLAARLKPGVEAAQVASAMKAELGRSDPNAAKDFVIIAGQRFVQPPIVQPLKSQLTSTVRKPALVLFGAVLFALLIACTNVSTLVLSRAVARGREFAVRRALGGSTPRLIRQALTEHAFLGLTGGACGSVLAYWSVVGLKTFLPADWPGYAALGLDYRVLLFAVFVSLLAGVAAGLLPAVRVVSGGPMQRDLAQGPRATESAGTARLRGTMVLFQTALAMILLAGAGVMLRSLVRLIEQGPGFRTDHVLAISISRHSAPGTAAFYAGVLDRLRSSPGIMSASAVNYLPMAQTALMMLPATTPGGRRVGVSPSTIAPDYFRTMGIRFLAGRDFDQHDGRGDSRSVIVNDEAARRLWPATNPVGRQVTIGKTIFNVIGVTRAARLLGPASTPWPEVYLPYEYHLPDFFSFVIHAQGPLEDAIAAAKAAVSSADPDQPINSIATMDDYVRRELQHPRALATALSVFSAVGLLLAIFGIYGVIAYSVSHRARELGICLALGAQTGSLIRNAVSAVMRYVLAGVIIGVAGAAACGRLVESEVYGVRSTDPAVLAGLAMIFMAIAAGAGFIAARRIASLDPAIVLRQE